MRDDRPPGLTPGQAAWCRSVALADAAQLVIPARLGIRTRAVPIPTATYPKIFVVGCPRSGTTWVADLLRQHPRVIGGRESHVYPMIHRSIGSKGRHSLMGWARLLYGVDRGARLGRPAGLNTFVDRRDLAHLGRCVLAEATNDEDAAERLVRAILDTYFLGRGGTREHVLMEKTPRHLFFAETMLSSYPEARVVEVVRDGRDVCVSMQMGAMRESAWPTARAGQIELWIRSVRHGLALRSDLDLRDRVTVVRYEDLKADTSAEVERLFTAVGLDAPPDLVANVAAATHIDHYPTGRGEFRYRGEVGTWVDHFSEQDHALFRMMVGDLFDEIGYSYD